MDQQITAVIVNRKENKLEVNIWVFRHTADDFVPYRVVGTTPCSTFRMDLNI
jgi:hypothetical protein